MEHAPNLHIFPPGAMARFWSLLGSAAKGVYLNGALGTAKAVAYSAVLAFFPVLTTLAAILVQAEAQAVSRTIVRLLYDVVPPGTDEVVQTLFVVHGQKPKWLLVGAIVLAAWAASGAVMSLIEGFRAVYGVAQGRPFVRERLIAIGLVFTSALPVIAASVLIVFGRRLERDVVTRIGLTHDGADLTGWILLGGQALRFLIAVGAIVVASAVLYYAGPNRKQSFRQVLPGALLATILWLLTTLGFGWYVSHVSNYNVLYGSVGAGLALLVWMYLLAVILLFGCEFNAERERRGLRAGI